MATDLASGLFFPDDTFCPARLNPADHALGLNSVSSYPRCCSSLPLTFITKQGISFSIMGSSVGGGPWEGDGFRLHSGARFAATSNSHFDDSEPFIQARIRVWIIEAVRQ